MLYVCGEVCVEVDECVVVCGFEGVFECVVVIEVVVVVVVVNLVVFGG